MLANWAALGLLKVKLFSNESYDVVSPVQDVTNKISLHESNYIVHVLSCRAGSKRRSLANDRQE